MAVSNRDEDALAQLLEEGNWDPDSDSGAASMDRSDAYDGSRGGDFDKEDENEDVEQEREENEEEHEIDDLERQEERKGVEVIQSDEMHGSDVTNNLEKEESDFDFDDDAVVSLEQIDEWHEEIKHNAADAAILTWEKRLDLWSAKLRDVDYEDLVFEPVSALSKLKRYTWLGLVGRGQIGYACLRWLGGKIVARKRQDNNEGRYECVVNQDNLASMLEDAVGEADLRIIRIIRKLGERNELSSILEDLRGCKPDELLHRLQDEEDFGFIIPIMRLRFYDNAELSAVLGTLCKSELAKASDAQTIACLKDILRKLAEDFEHRDGSVRHLLDAAIDKFQRNKRVFIDALRRSVTQTQENGNEVVFVDPNRGAKLTPLDKWHQRNIRGGSGQMQAPVLSLKRRFDLVDAERKWFRQTRPIVNELVQAILPDSGEPDIFNLLNRDDEKLAMEEGTSKDTFTPKLRQYCSKKQRLMDLREASTLSACLTAARDPHIETRDQADGEAERVILVIGYRASNHQDAHLASGNEAPFVSRCLSVSNDDAGDKIIEVGSRLDGLYTRIPDEFCEGARDKIFNSVLPIREERDTLVFYEFVPSGVHAADSSPLERVLAEPPQLAGRTTRSQHENAVPASQATDASTPRSPTPVSRGRREGAMVRSLIGGGDSHDLHDGSQQQSTSHLVHAHHFTHILLEMDATPSKDDDVRSNEKGAYRSLEESCERRFLISLAHPGKVDVEGMRLPSLAVLPRSSVAPEQDNLSFRRYLVLLPATYLDFDSTLSERHELAGLLQRYAKTAYVETAETLAQVLSIFISVKERSDAVSPTEIVFEKLKANQLVLNCMSVTSLVSVAPDLFRGPVHEVWESILTPHDAMGPEELAAREAALALITGRSSGTPATAVLATDDMWGHLHDLLSTRTKFSCEDLDVEPSNFWSIADRLSRRAELSVSTFYFVRLTGRTNSGMLEKLLGVASESRCVKLIFYFTKGLMALYNRLSADIRPRVFLHDMVSERAKDVSPVIQTERYTVYDGLLRKVSRELIDSSSFTQQTLDRIRRRAEQATNWVQDVRDSLLAGDDAECSVRKNTRVIVTEDAEALTSTLTETFSRLDFLNARDPRCIEKLRGLLSLNVTESEEEPVVLVLLHAQLLVRDRLHVIASHCARCRKPLLLVVNAATRDLTSFQTTSIEGLTKFEHVDIFHARARLPSPDQPFYRVILGLRVLLGPHLDLTSDMSHVQSLSAFLEDDESASVPPFLSEFALRLSPQPALLQRMLRTLASDTKPDSKFTFENGSGAVLLGDVVASVLWTYVENLEDVTKMVHFADIANDPVMFLAPQALRVWILIACLEGQPAIRPMCAFEDRLNISRTDNPGEILCSPLNAPLDTDAAISAIREIYYVDPGRGDAMTPLSDIIEQTAIRGGDLHWNDVYRSWARTPEIPTPVLLHLLQEAPSRLLLALSLSKTRMASLPLPGLVVERLSQDLEAMRDAVTGPSQEKISTRVAAELQHRVAALAWSILKHQAARPSAATIQNSRDDFSSLIQDFLRSDLHFDFKSGTKGDRVLEQRLILNLVQIDDPATALLQQPKVAEVLLASSEGDRRMVQEVLGSNEKLVMGAALLRLCLHSSWREKLINAAEILHSRLEPLVKWATGSTADGLWDGLRRLRSRTDWHQLLSPAAMAEILVRGAASHPNKENEVSFPRFVREHVLQAILAQSGIIHGVSAQESYFLRLVKAIAPIETKSITDWDRFNVCLRMCSILRTETVSDNNAVSSVLEVFLRDIEPSVYRFSILSIARNSFAFEELQFEHDLELVVSPELLRLYVEYNARNTDASDVESLNLVSRFRGMMQSSQDIEDDQLALNTALSLQKAANGAGSRGPSLVSARTLLRVKSEPSYGVLEVAPGLHPVLRKPEDQEDEDPVRYVRHSPFSFDGDLGAGAGIAHVFANNGETWELFQELPNNSTILGRGFYLRKTQQGTWVMLMATSRDEERDCPQLFLHTIVENHRLAAFNFHDEVVAVLECIVQVAFTAGVPQMECPDSFEKMAKAIKALQREEDSIPRKRNSGSESENGQRVEDEMHDENEMEDEEDEDGMDSGNAGSVDGQGSQDSLERGAKPYTSYKEAELRHVTWMLEQLDEVRGKAGDHTIVIRIAKKLEMASPEIQDRMTKALTVIMTTTDHEARSQLYFVLELVEHNLRLSSRKHAPDPAQKNKLMALHAHIAKHKFRSIGLQLLDEFDEDYALSGIRVFTKDFEDSDDEDEVADPKHPSVTQMRAGGEDDGGVRQRVEEACKMISNTGASQDDDASGETEAIEVKNSNLFDYDAGGYGEMRDSNRIVWTLHGSEPGRRLYFCPLDTRQLKLQYSDAHGLPIAYIFHERLLARALQNREPQEAMSHRDSLLDWLGKLARSPLPASVKRFMMATLEHGAPSCTAPALTRHGATLNKDEDVDEDEDINLLAITNCVAAAMPREEAVREQLTRVYTIKPGMRKFIKRKNDMYGVHVVRRQEWDTLERHGVVPVECDLGHDSLINARDDASMYLRIIGCFSEFTWLVWVRGLPTVSDQLLKWIAEYTKHHPWRFVYLEECDTSWNFGENRDRCVLTRAPMTASRLLTCRKDLQRAQLRANRPVHEFDVDEKLVDTILSASKGWDGLEKALKTALLSSTQLQGSSKEMLSDDENVVIDFLKEGAPAASATKQGVSIEPGAPSEGSSWLSADGTTQESRGSDDYRDQMRLLLRQPDPKIVLLVSPPGAGKSHFSDELGKELKKTFSLGFAYVDGSDDELVDTALASVLTRKVPEEGGRMFLVATPELTLELFRAVGKSAKTVIGAMVQAALLTWDNDVGRDFPDFVERDLRGANGLSPAIKIAAWCCMMRSESKKGDASLQDLIPAETIFKTLFIDQVGFPHQLSDRASLTDRKCPTFSWGGSYESLKNMSDALRRGHSINFADVYEKEWRQNEVVALNEFVVLLSACRSPATVLLALRRENLVALMQGALSDDALKLAKYVLSSGVFEKDADSHGHNSPYRAAVWTLLMCETEQIDVKELVERYVPREELVKALAWAPDNVASLRATRAKDRGMRERTLTNLLVGLSKWLIARGDDAARVHLLWRGFLAPLLDPIKCPDVAEIVAKFEDDMQTGWNKLMRKLWLLAKGRAQTADLMVIKAVADWTLYKTISGPFRVTYATGLLLSNSSIPLDAQNTLLQKEGSEVDLGALQQHGLDGNVDLNDLIKENEAGECEGKHERDERSIGDGAEDASATSLKIILLGDSATGKSKLIERYLMDEYCPHQDSTYALTLFKHQGQVEDPRTGAKKKVNIDFWDTAGQERFQKIHSSFYYRAHGCILVFDVTRKATYQHLPQWLAELRQYAENVPCLVVANKIDVDMKVTRKTFSFPKKNGLDFMFVSAADGTNVVSAFEEITQKAYEHKASGSQSFLTEVMDLLDDNAN
ncbi:Rab-like protein 2A [Hondaea fermentalgiana]|uniref:Rab-like protein 2A n=1 Tax=Hondaea fermentalgiana TaxID=2315210 RepID=A0A2R5GKC8_9STRA|nr:Rab-like protein 2A [Hondaea fermentalgiana]|eukprot:GBG31366.1 Rab-like protein 2A [Hondaea fermentalgiana]